jgi:hypothetical protein
MYDGDLMIWFYKRGHASLSLETRYDNTTADYVAIAVYPDGRRETERFKRREEFAAWLEAFEERLSHEQWGPDGPPHVIPDGWPDKPPLM